MAASISAAVLMPDTLAGKPGWSKWGFGVDGVWQARAEPRLDSPLCVDSKTKGQTAAFPERRVHAALS